MTTIGSSAFDQSDITTISLPQGLETIGSNAFYLSNLTQLIIPSSVTSIGDRSLPTQYSGTTYEQLKADKFEDYYSMEYVSLLLPSVTTDSDASGIKVQCTFVHEMMDPMDHSIIIETTKFSPKVYYNWNGSGTYQDATDAEKLNKANYTEVYK